MKFKLGKKQKILLKRYRIDIDMLLNESEIMEGKRTLQPYIDNVENCYEETRGLWPIKNIHEELFEIIHIMEKIESKINKVR